MLHKRGRIWCVRFKHQGQVIEKSTRERNRSAAEVAAARIKVEYRDQNPRIVTGCGLTQLAAADLSRALAAGADPKTRERTLNDIWNPLLDYFGEDYDPRGLTYDNVEEYVAHRRKNGIRGQTIRREIQALKRGLKIAKRRGWIGVLLDEWPTIRADPPKESQRGRFHPPAILAAVLREVPPQIRDKCELGMLTGLRAAELERLTMALQRTHSSTFQAVARTRSHPPRPEAPSRTHQMRHLRHAGR